MKLSGNTVLITGGTSGIGFELASQLVALGNTVIVTGRDTSLLEAVRAKLGVRAIASDVSDSDAVARLTRDVVGEFPELNVLINNAGIMRRIDLLAFIAQARDVRREVDVDLVGAIDMTLAFLPHLAKQERAAVVNVSSGLAFVPLPIAPVYCAAKAGIHSFTQSLRVQLRNTNITVFELAPPITRTALFQGDLNVDDIGVKAMDATTVAKRALEGLERDRLEIRPGPSNLLKLMSRIAPNFILDRLSKPAMRLFPGASRVA